ncbi:MAG: precorrin-3B C(17)-methyltransferase [Magnetococcales bacterium]|nr:precorrin-3B C(17)-methyltransferase [Magnetococcales bacterium]
MNNPQGKLYLISIGPGSQKTMTGRALEAIEEAQVVVGYKTYLQLIEELIADKQIMGSRMRQELERCTQACQLAMSGERVALISSGDVGIYGMAGPAYEVLLHAGWNPREGIEVEVIPGITALSACASLVGAPLTHDFCAISLSDLMTPWSVIEKRLEAAAQADFVTALYNPKSGKRVQHILEAQRIFLSHRSPETPVAVVNAAFRDKERTLLTNLAQMTTLEIGMQTTLLIGNSQSFIKEGVMVTPRGYTEKYGLDSIR